MFTFAVVRNSDKKKGTVVSNPLFNNDAQHVVVMWDDFSFSSEDVCNITGDPVNNKEGGLKVVDFPGDGGVH